MTHRVDSQRILAVGVGAMEIADDVDVRLVTYGIGSCIGVTAWDPVRKVGGLLHFMLPGDGPAAAQAVPLALRCRYAATALPLLFDTLDACCADRERLVVCAVGGAAVGDDAEVAAIGERNIRALRLVACELGISIRREAVGGSRARTVFLDVGQGTVGLREADTSRVLWHPREGV